MYVYEFRGRVAKKTELYLLDRMSAEKQGPGCYTHSRCNGSDEMANTAHTIVLLLLMKFRFLKLGMPMSSEIGGVFACALSTSWRVGAARSCIQRLEQPKSTVDTMLTIRCVKVLSAVIVPQSPR